MGVLKLFNAFYLVVLSLWLYRVQVLGQVYVASHCVTSEVYLEESADVTCFFSTDLQKSSKSFRLYRYDIDSGNTGSQQQDKYVIVLDCFWANVGDLECDPMPTGYEFNRTVTDRLTVTIAKVSLDLIGRYECRAQPSYARDIQHCFILPKAKAQTTTALVTTNIPPGGDEGGKAAGIIVGVILAILLVAGIFLLLFRRQLRRWLRRFRHKPQRQRLSGGTNGKRVLEPLVSTNISATEGPTGTIIDSKENRERLDAIVSVDTAAEDINENIPVSDFTGEPMMEATTKYEKTDQEKSPTRDLERVHVEGPEPVDNVGSDGNDDMQQEQEAPIVSEKLRHKDSNTSIVEPDDTKSGGSLRADEQRQRGDMAIPSTTQEAVSVSSSEAHGATSQSEGDRSDPYEKTVKASDQTKDADSPKKLLSEAVGVLEEGRNLNWRFYRNEIVSRPNGRSIEEIHAMWARDPDLLDRHHNYIQWLFPIPEVPTKNPEAQQLFDDEAKAIRSDEKTFERFLTSYKRMLNYLGLQLENTGEVSRAHNWNDRFTKLHDNANYYRISRILECLGVMGLERFKKPFIERILMEVLATHSIKGTLGSCLKFWIPLVEDAKEMEELQILHSTVSAVLSAVHT